MKQINSDIKTGAYKSAYLIYGEESYLVKEYTELLKNSIVNKENAMMNMDIFEGNNCDVNKIINAGDTAPFFSEYRLVVVE